MGWVRRLRSTFSRTAGDFDEERRFHIDERTDEYVRNGMSREEARRAALKRFGNATLAKERTLDVDVFRWIEDLRRDTGYALRMLWRSPGFTVLAIVCLTPVEGDGPHRQACAGHDGGAALDGGIPGDVREALGACRHGPRSRWHGSTIGCWESP